MDSILGDRQPTLEDLKGLWWTTRCLNEAMRLYPQPPVLIRRALEDDIVGGYKARRRRCAVQHNLCGRSFTAQDGQPEDRCMADVARGNEGGCCLIQTTDLASSLY